MYAKKCWTAGEDPDTVHWTFKKDDHFLKSRNLCI